MTSKRTLLVVLALLALAATACGVPEDSDPRLLAADEIPGLATDDPTPDPAPTPEDPTVTEPVQLFFLDGDGFLRSVRRDVSAPVDPAEVLTQLIDGPTEEERDALSLSTSIPETEGVLEGTSVADMVLNLELQEAEQSGIFDLEGPQQKNAIAQIVWTATALPGIEGVRVFIGSEFRSLPTDSEASEALLGVTRDDFRSFDPDAQPTATPESDG